jgi:hypothetical protein
MERSRTISSRFLNARNSDDRRSEGQVCRRRREVRNASPGVETVAVLRLCVHNQSVYGRALNEPSTRFICGPHLRDVERLGSRTGAHDDLDAVFKEMLQASGIALIDTLSQDDGSISFTEVITVGKAESVAGKSKWVAKLRM